MIDIASELESAYEEIAIPFIHNGETIYLMLDEDFDIVKSNQVVFRGLTHKLTNLSIGDEISSTYFRNNEVFIILNDAPYGDHEEERLISVGEQ